jgi:hypothetical protein
LHTSPQVDAAQVPVAFAPDGQAMPQPPQFAGSVSKSDIAISHPLAAVVSQSA